TTTTHDGQVNNNLTVDNDLTVKGQVKGDLSIEGTTTTHNGTVKNDLTVENDLTVNGTLKLADAGNIEFPEELSLKTLSVSETTTTHDGQVNNNLTVDNDLTVKGQVQGDLSIDGTTTTHNGAVKNDLTVENDLTVNGTTQTTDIIVNNSLGKKMIELSGAGEIRFVNADCAEDFDIVEAEEVEPGTVMVLDQAGRLRQSSAAYDKKVAGVISGAGGYRPGIVLDQQHNVQSRRLPIALVGKVYCKVDADQSSVEVGDLLTTSTTPGHAMKASDHFKAFGAVIGKALHSLENGKGLIPVLVALQ
ncbi:MAG: polymer-forming cytoskeletal protein, partial [Chloroflexi bacterium]|nr:polymer-forming cytoskeletal protein [Chloroflexota bacterium]